MGTRNSTIIYLNGEPVMGNYCQWDGYPESAGVGILRVIREAGYHKLRAALENIVIISDDEIRERWAECGADLDSPFVSTDVSNRLRYPQFHRDSTGYEIIAAILDATEANPLQLPDPAEAVEFAKDGLFCEYCYVIDLDRQVFAVFQGFNAGVQTPLFTADEGSEYKAVGLVAWWSLNDLPSDGDFLATWPDGDAEDGEMRTPPPLPEPVA